MATCLNNLNLNVPQKTIGFINGWFGIIWRIALAVYLAWFIQQNPDLSPKLYLFMLIGLLSYILFSFIINIMFLIGLRKEKPYLLLPYIGIGVMEMFLIFSMAIGGCTVLLGMKYMKIFYGILPAAILIAAVYLFFWLKSVNLFQAMEVEVRLKKADQKRVETIRQLSILSQDNDSGKK